MSEVAYCGSSEPHAEHEVGGVGRMGPFTTTCEGIPARERTAAGVVQITRELIDAAESGSGYGGDISRDTYRAIVISVFRAAGFEVEES